MSSLGPPQASGIMSVPSPIAGVEDVLTPELTDGQPPEDGVTRHKKLGLGFWLPVGWLMLIIILAAMAPILPLPNPNAINSAPKLGLSTHHLLGTDDLGRDIFSRVIFGARVSLVVGFASVAMGLVVGGTLGLIAGFYGGLADTALLTLANVLLAYPSLVLALAIIAFIGQSLRNVVIVIAVLAVGPIILIVRANTLTFAQRDFVLSARALGAKGRRIIIREILPNVIPAAVAFSCVGIGLAIVAEGSLAFLGLSVPLPTPTWGGMINEGKSVLQQAPGVSLWPALAMFVTVLSLNLAGDRLRAFFDIREGAL